MKTHYSSNPRQLTQQSSTRSSQQPYYYPVAISATRNVMNAGRYGIQHAGFIYPHSLPTNYQHHNLYRAQTVAAPGLEGYHSPVNGTLTETRPSDCRPVAPKSFEVDVSSGTICSPFRNMPGQQPLKKSGGSDPGDLCQRFNALKIKKSNEEAAPTSLTISQTAVRPIHSLLFLFIYLFLLSLISF